MTVVMLALKEVIYYVVTNVLLVFIYSVSKFSFLSSLKVTVELDALKSLQFITLMSNWGLGSPNVVTIS